MAYECLIRSELIKMNLEEMQNFCAKFDCTVVPEPSTIGKPSWYIIKTDDPTNFFWLGANFGAANPFPTGFSII